MLPAVWQAALASNRELIYVFVEGRVGNTLAFGDSGNRRWQVLRRRLDNCFHLRHIDNRQEFGEQQEQREEQAEREDVIADIE